MARDPNCIFCKIVSVEIPASVVYESESVLAFLDIAPLAEGHLLVIPRDHFFRLDELLPSVAAEIGTVLPRLARAVLDVTGAEGYNLLQNNGKSAGQLVGHVHFHLIPRVSNDGLGYRWNPTEYAAGRAETLTAQYQEVLARLID